MPHYPTTRKLHEMIALRACTVTREGGVVQHAKAAQSRQCRKMLEYAIRARSQAMGPRWKQGS